uniref:Exonuclease n=1 Tax=uncultured marine thaumarchaeote KM3_85_E11 TaxID=1456317 RepID=A0A075HX40_9ARCH|nr:exonuclease [uncultured marine thaumarchaeote KM3_85_E11]
MFNHIECPEIPSIKRITVDGKRHYQTPTGVYVSITETLRYMPLPPGLVEWKEKVGEDVANYKMREGGIRGTRLHNAVESYLSGKPMLNIKQEYGVTAAGLFEIMMPALNQIDNIMALEKPIYSTALEIAGTPDCVAEFGGVLSLIDFKSATRMKDDIENWLIQTTFYSIAWEELTGQKIPQVVIILATEDGKLEVFKSNPMDHIQKLEKAIDYYKKGVAQ